MEATGQSPSLEAHDHRAVVGGAEPQRAAQGSAGPEAQRTLEQMGNTTPPLGGVNKSVGNFEGTLQRAATTDRQGGRMRPRANVPRVPTRMRRRQGSRRSEHAIRADGGRWAGDCGGLPPRTQRTQTQPAGQLAAHRAGGSEALASGGLGRPLPVRTAPGRKGRFRRSRRLNITRRTLPILPF